MTDQPLPVKPELPAELCEDQPLQVVAQAALLADGDVLGFRFVRDQLDGLHGSILEFSGCCFEHCYFGELSIKRMSFVDCVFEKCELDNLRLYNTTFQRVTFAHCRMTGMELGDAVWMNVSCEDCMMDYLSVGDSKLERSSFLRCRLRESLWSNVKLQRMRFLEADLTQAQWMRTPLRGLDVSTCEIGGWSIELGDVRGLRVTSLQLVQLSGLLGVTLVE
ncbi:MAG: pentapeptide repeat-containing protein [Clostridia bacterium]